MDSTESSQLSLLSTIESLRTGKVTSADLVGAALDRIDQVNGPAPSFDGTEGAINAWVRLYPERARAAAQEADMRLAQEGDDAPLLCGVPIGIKDLYAVEGLPLTASSAVLEGNIADESSALTRHLETQGAVVIGHTHTHEFAAGGSTHQVGNPWDLSRSAGGSSGGSAAAVASGQVPLTLGTDTAGSIRIPASLCGVSGFKPSISVLPTDGIIPLSYTLDHAGPLAPTIADCAVALNSLRDAPRTSSPFGLHSAARLEELPTRALNVPTPLKGVRIALTGRNMGDIVEREIVEALEQARAACEALGGEIVELPQPRDMDKAAYDTILLAESRDFHRQFAEQETQYRGSTRDFLAFGSAPITAQDYLGAQRDRIRVTKAWDTWFQENRIDAVLEPTQAIVAPKRGHGYDPDQQIGGEDPMTLFTALWNYTGFPAATLPVGVGPESGMPLGVSLISAFGRDRALVEICLSLQAQALPALKKPGQTASAGAQA